MKKILSLALFLLAAPFWANADFSLAQWRYYKEVGNISGDLAKVTLDDEVFAHAAKGLADLRVVDASGKEVPYKLVSAKEESGRTNYVPRIFNNSFVPEKFSTAMLDLGESGKLTNSLTISTSTENFQRNVTVYGGEDGHSWNVLKSGSYIYDYTDRKGALKTQNTTVAFPDSTYRYFKIEISDDGNNPVQINSVSMGQFVQKGAQRSAKNPQFEANDNNQEKTTELLIDLGSNGIPTSKLSFAVEGGNFNRNLLVYASNDKGAQNWRMVSQGYMFRYNTARFVGENLALEIPETTERYLKVVVYNKDNAPLTFTGVTTYTIVRELGFQANANGPYRIYYGNGKARSAEYDLDEYFQYLDWANAKNVSLGVQKMNANFVPEVEPEKPLSEKIPYLFTVVLALTGCLLLVLVYKFLKNQ